MKSEMKWENERKGSFYSLVVFEKKIIDYTYAAKRSTENLSK